MPFAATWMELQTFILSEVSQKEKDKYHMISLISGFKLCQTYAYANLSTEKKLMDLENRHLVAKGDGEGVGWIESLGLVDANYCIWSG